MKKEQSSKEKRKRMEELVEKLNQANLAYYQKAEELISNYEYDRLYDELQTLEQELQTVLSNSPTIHVGYEVQSELPRERHESPMLSLDKTKEPERLEEFAGEQKVLVSWKLDGLTVVLTYEQGELTKAVTRGNGEIGEVITANARVFQNLPLRIPYQGKLILRGEAVIRYEDFEKINEELGEDAVHYKNPRNLCSGSVRQLDSRVTAKRRVQLVAFSLVYAEGVEFQNSRQVQLSWLKEQGFQVVEYELATRETLRKVVEKFAHRIQENSFPSDGLVLVYDDIAYGTSLGRTAKFPRDSFAFKWADEVRETVLRAIEWSPSRTGLINPIAVFDTVELEGTEVSRASVHNISVLRELALGIGDFILVYKANMIIPQISENLTKSDNVEIPRACPVCGGRTEVRKEREAQSLYCTNPFCQAKQIKSFVHFVSRDALNIEGLSQATLEKLVGKGFVRDFADLFHLDAHREELIAMEGFGEKSYERLMESIQKARITTLPRVIYSLGISGIGLANAKLICNAFEQDIDGILTANRERLSEIDGVGAVLAESFAGYFENPDHVKRVKELLKEFSIPEEKKRAGAKAFAGMSFVVTGTVEQFANRSVLKEYIEERGGKVTGAVTSKTTYLINNDNTSSSTKNKKAMELGVPILTEEELLKLAQ